ncbi:MAG: GNAT family N-acetyltransferase [Salinarimonas sp.]|nr:GNAT family N-acetyltransferase [Salinarimonas sp.]
MTRTRVGPAGLEERALNAWPALQSLIVDGWLVRFADGYTKRANSACALPSGARPLAEAGPAIEDLYRRNGQEPIFRLTPFATRGDDAWLDARGYARIEPTSVMYCEDPAGHATKDPALGFASTPDETWLAGFIAENRHGTHIRPTLIAMLAAIRVEAFYATLIIDGEPCGYGLAVIERGCVGLFDILVASHLRGRGLGRRLVAGMLAEAVQRGAGAAYLQVLETNETAIALYRRLGFTESFSYAYRVAPR